MMTVKRMIRIIRWLLPLALGATVLALWLRAGAGGAPLAVAVLIGVLLGWAVVLVLEGVLAMAGLRDDTARVSERRLQQLERDKLMLLRSIKEIEFDASLQRLDPEEAAAISAPLRARAMRILRELDQARQEGPLTIEQQIEHELARRLGQPATEGKP